MAVAAHLNGAEHLALAGEAVTIGGDDSTESVVVELEEFEFSNGGANHLAHVNLEVFNVVARVALAGSARGRPQEVVAGAGAFKRAVASAAARRCRRRTCLGERL